MRYIFDYMFFFNLSWEDLQNIYTIKAYAAGPQMPRHVSAYTIGISTSICSSSLGFSRSLIRLQNKISCLYMIKLTRGESI